MCVLPNENFLCCSVNDSLKLFDKNFKFLKEIKNIAKYAIFATTNNNDKIYIPNRDGYKHGIVMTDLNLNKIKAVGTYGNQSEQFNTPFGLSYYNGFLYVCDHNNKRIQKLTSQLNFVQYYPLNYDPWQIKVFNNTACVTSSNGNSIYFYDTKNFKLKRKYEGISGYISEINGYFYVYCQQNKKISCFDENGELNDEINMNRLDNVIADHWDGCLEIFNNHIGCSSFSSNKFILIKKL